MSAYYNPRICIILQVQWCKVIFTEKSDEFALNVLLTLYTETIRMMEPTILYCFDVESKKEPFLALLLQFNQITHRFVQNLRQFIEASCEPLHNFQIFKHVWVLTLAC